jgi:hypothetical protein
MATMKLDHDGDGDLPVANSAGDSTWVNNYALLSCRINGYIDPPLFEVEKIPVSPPQYIQAKQETTEQDLYFLRWVLRVS